MGSSEKNIYLNGIETIANAQQRFYLPIALKDPLDTETKFFYDAYNLVIIKTQDALQSEASAEIVDYRTLQPVVLKDMNDNISEILSDELGMVIAVSVHGTEGNGNHGDEPLTNYTIIIPANVKK